MVIANSMLNNVVLVGRVVRQPELTETQEKKQVTNITLAVSRAFKNSNTGEYDTDFISITLWETLAKTVCEYCGKGDIIGVRGRLIHRTYEAPNFKSIKAVEVVAERVSFIQTKPQNQNHLEKDSQELFDELPI